MPDPLERYLRTVGEIYVESITEVKRFILFAVAVLLLVTILWIPVYVALGGGGF